MAVVATVTPVPFVSVRLLAVVIPPMVVVVSCSCSAIFVFCTRSVAVVDGDGGLTSPSVAASWVVPSCSRAQGSFSICGDADEEGSLVIVALLRRGVEGAAPTLPTGGRAAPLAEHAFINPDHEGPEVFPCLAIVHAAPALTLNGLRV